MNRASLDYLLIAARMVVGLWAVLSLGAGLEAPPDLAGTWEVLDSDSSPAHLGKTLVIEQSGKYFRLGFQNGTLLDLKLTGRATARRGEGYARVLELSGRGTSVRFELDPGSDRMALEMSGGTAGSAVARRTARTYPARSTHAPR